MQHYANTEDIQVHPAMAYARMRTAMSMEFCKDGSPLQVIFWRAKTRCFEFPEVLGGEEEEELEEKKGGTFWNSRTGTTNVLLGNVCVMCVCGLIVRVSIAFLSRWRYASVHGALPTHGLSTNDRICLGVRH